MDPSILKDLDSGEMRSPISDIVEPLKQEILNLKSQLVDAQTQLAQFKYDESAFLDSPDSHLELDCETRIQPEERADIKYSNIVPIHKTNISNTTGFAPAPITKIAERIKLRRATDGQKELNTNELLKTDLPTAIAEHIVGDILRQCDVQTEKHAVEIELRRLATKLEHTRSHNSVLELTLCETKAQCDRYERFEYCMQRW